MHKPIQIFEDILSGSQCEALITKFKADPNVTSDPQPDYSNRKYLNISQTTGWFSAINIALQATHKMAEVYFSRPEGMDEVTIDEWLDDGFILAHYRVGDDLALHVDGQSSEPGRNGLRLATALFFLNTAEGGELEFPLQETSIEPVQGRGIMFPVEASYPHRVREARSDRFVLQTWLTDPRYAVVDA